MQKKDRRWLICEQCYDSEIVEFKKLKGIDSQMASRKKNNASIKRAVVRKNYDDGKKWGNYYQDICYCLKEGKCNAELEMTVLGQDDD